MRLRHRHRTRNLAIGAIITAAATGAATYAIYKLMERKNKQADNTDRHVDENEKIIESASDVLVSKIGATDSEIEEVKLLHKTAYDLAKDKGFSEEQLKMFINQERVRPIDELVLNRKISNNVGAEVKEKIVQHTNCWDGKLD
jgi:hypothetical protein